ncbi:MAG: tetratricopeptide repeat protein, partial [Myxococcales bacterium]|nr:tetratricopeptide repeat protein [Myxococcales bacterium]
GITLSSLGELALAEGDYPRARARFEQTLALFERSLGPEHAAVADTATNLGVALLHLGDPSAALVHLERAMEIRAKTESAPDAAAETQFRLAQALWDARPTGADRRRALELAEKADADAVASGVKDELRAEIEAWRAARSTTRDR